jgi:hypothetical protein
LRSLAVVLVSALWIIWMGLAVMATAVWIVGVVDCAYRRYPSAAEKWAWLLVAFFGHGLGALIYWFVGRERGTLGPV